MILASGSYMSTKNPQKAVVYDEIPCTFSPAIHTGKHPFKSTDHLTKLAYLWHDYSYFSSVPMQPQKTRFTLMVWILTSRLGFPQKLDAVRCPYPHYVDSRQSGVAIWCPCHASAEPIQNNTQNISGANKLTMGVGAWLAWC